MNALQHLSRLLKDQHQDAVSGRIDCGKLAKMIDEALMMAWEDEHRMSKNGGLINSDKLDTNINKIT